jgi:hypothetical protein
MSKRPWRLPTVKRVAAYVEAAKAKGASEVIVDQYGQIRILLHPGPSASAPPTLVGVNEWDRVGQ